MQYEVIKLREVFPILAAEPLDKLRTQREAYSLRAGLTGSRAAYLEPTLTAYCPDNAEELGPNHTRPSVIICPGGSYQFVAFREAEPVALAFIAHGYNAFVLNYSVAPVRWPTALLELAASAALIRERAAQFHVDKGTVAVAGFSAGGHLTACLGTFWKQPWLSEQLGLHTEDIRPNALILSYPVISFTRFAHTKSRASLLGDGAEETEKSLVSLENHVTPDTPPTFLWHTAADPVVPMENSLLFASALREHQIPLELHIYPEGGHGLSLATAETARGEETRVNPHCATWFALCDQWLRLVFPSHFSI